jgi:predicted nucleic acid-binding protein
VGRLMAEVGEGPVALDTCIFIYFLEDHPRFGGPLEELFRAIDRGVLPAVTSEITLLELLVAPLRQGDQSLADQYQDYLVGGRGLLLRSLDRSLIRAAAQLRAARGVRVPDALQLAAGLAAGCRVFLTNDRRLPDIGTLRVRQLPDWL